MFFTSGVFASTPENFSTPLQEKTYRVLIDFHIPFEQIENNEAITMEYCVQVDAKRMKRIDHINDSVYSLAGGAGSHRETGGMRTKLQAAALATAQWIDTVILNGKAPHALYDIVGGVNAGTLFVGRCEK